MNHIHIETERLLLRPFKRGDAAAASHNSKQPTVAHFMSDMVLETQKAASKWIRWINKEKFNTEIPCVVLAVTLKSSQKCIGLIGLAPKRELDNEIEILFEIADAYQNRGYITESGKALLAWGFANTPAAYFVAIVKLDNPASVRVIEKLGFAYSGERRIEYDGTTTDFHYYRIEKEEWREHH